VHPKQRKDVRQKLQVSLFSESSRFFLGPRAFNDIVGRRNQ
jgi:hypothetical protein